MKKQYPLVIYYTLSIIYSALIPIIGGCLTYYNKILGAIFFNVSTIANFSFFFTHFCPFRIYARWYYQRHLNFWTMLRRNYKSQGRWIIALILYIPAVVVFIKSVNKLKVKGNIWYLPRSSRSGDEFSRKHPASFPEQLANDHIISWSNENDLIYDPFMGSGTTAKMAILNNRKYIGSEISEEYCKIIETRIKECGGLFFNSFETELSNEAGT